MNITNFASNTVFTLVDSTGNILTDNGDTLIVRAILLPSKATLNLYSHTSNLFAKTTTITFEETKQKVTMYTQTATLEVQ